MAADDALPVWPEIRDGALQHLFQGRIEMSNARDWLTGIDSPLTPGQRQAAGEALKLIGQARELIDQARRVLDA